MNKYLYYTDRFFGKDGIYTPHHIFKKDKYESHTNNMTVLPDPGADQLNAKVENFNPYASDLDQNNFASTFGNRARAKSIVYYKNFDA